MKRVPVFIAGLLAVVSLAVAFAFALTGPADRAAAVAGVLTASASAVAALTALFISLSSLARSDRQLETSRAALEASQLPFISPVHESRRIPGSGALTFYPPTKNRLPAIPDGIPLNLFVADTNNTFTVPVENIGIGPALGVEGELSCSDGRTGLLTGAVFVAAGRQTLLTVEIAPVTAVWDKFEAFALGATCEPIFLLELRYTDVFGADHASRSVFRPEGLGSWQQVAYR
jgi:hypothetical protein